MKSYRKIHRYRKKKLILKNRFFWLTTLVLVSFTSLFSFLFFSGTFLVEKIVVSGQEKVSKEAIGSLVVSKNIFFIDREVIRAKILENFPQIAEVKIDRSFPDSLNILVIERVSVATWCQENDCFLMDNNGIIFEKIAAGDDLQQTLIKGLNEGKLALGSMMIDEEELSKILNIDSELKSSLKIEIEEFTISLDDKLIALTRDNWEIYFSLTNDIDWQITKLRVVLEEKIPPEKRENLEYIEVRFGNLAPIKYKD